MGRHLSFIAVFVFAILVMFAMTVFTVDQRQWAIISQFGEIKEVVSQPGLSFKWPLIQNVRFFDKRILTYDSSEPANVVTAEKKPVLVDFFVKWRIRDPRQYYISVNGDEEQARTRLSQTVDSNLRDEFGKRTVHDVISGERDKIMTEVQRKADASMRTIGVQIVDVRIKRVEFTESVSDSVYRRMEAERKRVANELRSQGAAEAEKIRADADKQREVIIAEAYREAQKTKGEGDAKAAAIYAKAFGRNPEFYAFYRSLEAYRASFKNKNDLLVVEPNSEFFKYLKSAGKGGK